MNKHVFLVVVAGAVFLAGCGPTFDAASLIETTRVVGARIEVEGAPERATPKPGEIANVTWLLTSPGATPPLSWAFAVCAPGTSLGCDGAPLAMFAGTTSPPRLAIPVPAAGDLGAATRLTLYGQICDGVDATPVFDPPGCTSGHGTTVSVTLRLQLGDEANLNPVAERAFTFDGDAWAPLPAGADPCAAGPRVSAGTKDHVLGSLTEGIDRETYTALLGDPPVATSVRETLQLSQFTTAGELNRQFAFVDVADTSASTTVDDKWAAPEAADVPAAGLPVTFTFVVRDDRGGVDWTTRAACVVP
jgi:hypothetical protein